jgi:isochorismate hydrolase
MATRSRMAVLILDLISDYQYPDAHTILPAARRLCSQIAQLKARARRCGIPVIYVNDTRGHWESDQRKFVERCLHASPRAAQIVRALLPESNDYFLFKPRHSAFFETSLGELLGQLEVSKLVLTGLTAHQCVLFTAVDAHVRKYDMVIASDCVASATSAQKRHALFVLEHSTKAQVLPARRIIMTRRNGTRKRAG